MASTCLGSGSPRQRIMNRSAMVWPLSTSPGDHRRGLAAGGLADERDGHDGGAGEVLAGSSSLMSSSGGSPTRGELGQCRLDVDADVAGVHRERERLGRRQAGVELVVDEPQTWPNDTRPTRSLMSTPQRSAPPSLSGSAISDSKATTPSRPGRPSGAAPAAAVAPVVAVLMGSPIVARRLCRAAPLCTPRSAVPRGGSVAGRRRRSRTAAGCAAITDLEQVGGLEQLAELGVAVVPRVERGLVRDVVADGAHPRPAVLVLGSGDGSRRSFTSLASLRSWLRVSRAGVSAGRGGGLLGGGLLVVPSWPPVARQVRWRMPSRRRSVRRRPAVARRCSVVDAVGTDDAPPRLGDGCRHRRRRVRGGATSACPLGDDRRLSTRKRVQALWNGAGVLASPKP